MRPARGFILPLIIALIASLAILAAVAIWQLKPKQQTPIPKPQTQSQQAIQSSSTKSTANWKTYNGKNFSLKYPLAWTIKWDDSETLTIVNPTTQHGFLVKTGQYNKSLDQWVSDLSNSNPPDEMIEKKLTNLDSEKAYYLKFSHTIGQKQTTIYNLITFHNKVSYQLIFDDTDDVTFNQILSTFKFTDTLTIFFNEKATKTQVDATITELKKQNEVVDIKVATPEEALAIYKQRNSNNLALTENISAVDFPETVQVVVESSAKDKILDLVKNKSFIDRIL